jgi:predicted acyl esterase
MPAKRPAFLYNLVLTSSQRKQRQERLTWQRQQQQPEQQQQQQPEQQQRQRKQQQPERRQRQRKQQQRMQAWQRKQKQKFLLCQQLASHQICMQSEQQPADLRSTMIFSFVILQKIKRLIITGNYY